MSWVEEQDWFGLEDIAYETELEAQRQYEQNLEDHIWIGANNKRYVIEYMQTSHIKNCIKMIYRKNGTCRSKYLRLFENELRRRKYEKDKNNNFDCNSNSLYSFC